MNLSEYGIRRKGVNDAGNNKIVRKTTSKIRIVSKRTNNEHRQDYLEAKQMTSRIKGTTFSLEITNRVKRND